MDDYNKVDHVCHVLKVTSTLNELEQYQEHDGGNGDVDGDAFLVPQLLQAEGAILPFLDGCVLVFKDKSLLWG